MNKEDIVKLHRLGWLNYSQIGLALWPHLDSKSASAKIKNKMDANGKQRMLKTDWDLIFLVTS